MVEGARLESVYAAYAVSGVQIPISPPEYYFDIFNKFSELKNKANKELFELNNLFSGLQQKAFNGTL